MNYFVIIISLILVLHPTGGETNDERCSCKCPEVYWVDADIETDFPERKLYINSSVRAVDCDCEHVVQPVLNLSQEQVEKLCPRCRCSHEQRSTTTIKIVVIIILWILVSLSVYLLYLVFVEPILKGKPIQVLRSPSAPYQPQDDEGSLDNDNVGNSTPMRAYRGPGGVVNRLGREQDRWKRQLEIQRYSVYDRHTMLN